MLEEKSVGYQTQWDRFSPQQQEFLLQASSVGGQVSLKNHKKLFKKEHLYDILSPLEEGEPKFSYLFGQWIKKLDR